MIGGRIGGDGGGVDGHTSRDGGSVDIDGNTGRNGGSVDGDTGAERLKLRQDLSHGSRRGGGGRHGRHVLAQKIELVKILRLRVLIRRPRKGKIGVSTTAMERFGRVEKGEKTGGVGWVPFVTKETRGERQLPGRPDSGSTVGVAFASSPEEVENHNQCQDDRDENDCAPDE